MHPGKRGIILQTWMKVRPIFVMPRSVSVHRRKEEHSIKNTDYGKFFLAGLVDQEEYMPSVVALKIIQNPFGTATTVGV
jgi:hypothetical protein